MKYINIFDLDGVLVYPNEFHALVERTKDLQEQYRLGRTTDFLIKLVIAGEAPWYKKNLEWLETDTIRTIIVTGRYTHHKRPTKIWLKNHGIKYDQLELMHFIDWENYLVRRKSFIKLIVNTAKYNGNIVRYFEDNDTIYEWAKDLDPDVLEAYHIVDGELVNNG